MDVEGEIVLRVPARKKVPASGGTHVRRACPSRSERTAITTSPPISVERRTARRLGADHHRPQSAAPPDGRRRPAASRTRQSDRPQIYYQNLARSQSQSGVTMGVNARASRTFSTFSATIAWTCFAIGLGTAPPAACCSWDSSQQPKSRTPKSLSCTLAVTNGTFSTFSSLVRLP